MHIGLLLGQLEVGGAERQFLALASELTRRGHRVTFYTLLPGGGLVEEAAQVPGLRHVPLLRQRPRSGVVAVSRALLQLHRELRRDPPAVLHSAMEPTNIMAAVAGPVTRVPVVWGIECSGLGLGWKYGLFLRIGSLLRRRVDHAICNSHAGLVNHKKRRYLPESACVVLNGIDTERYRPDAADRARIREELDLKPDELLMGMVGRFHPVKRHDLFLQAAARVRNPQVRFACVTPRPVELPEELRRLSTAPALQGRLHWAAGGSEVASWYRALDLLVSASSTEGVSNAIAEAMASGTPCVVTDVGDSALLVGECGLVVPPGDADCLARAMEDYASWPLQRRQEMGTQARSRIQEHFSLAALADRTEDILLRVARREKV